MTSKWLMGALMLAWSSLGSAQALWDSVAAVPAVAADTVGAWYTCPKGEWFREPPEQRAPVLECRVAGKVADKKGGKPIGPVTLQEVLDVHMPRMGLTALGPLPVQVAPGSAAASRVQIYVAYRRAQ